MCQQWNLVWAPRTGGVESSQPLHHLPRGVGPTAEQSQNRLRAKRTSYRDVATEKNDESRLNVFGVSLKLKGNLFQSRSMTSFHHDGLSVKKKSNPETGNFMQIEKCSLKW